MSEAGRHVAIWDEAFAFQGPGADAARVEHQALLVCLALGAPYGFSARGSAMAPCTGLVLAPHVPHGYRAEGCRILSVFVEPESPLGRRITLARLSSTDVAPFEAAWVASFVERTEGLLVEARARALLAEIVPADAPLAALDPRVAQALSWARAHLSEDPTLATMAARAGLSTERFRHLFRIEVGTPLRRWLRWARLRRAVELALAGASLTSAAHEAGFSDQAHLSRTFSGMFGLSPFAARPDGR